MDKQRGLRKITLSTAVIAIVVLLCVVLSACNLFNNTSKITKVDIVVSGADVVPAEGEIGAYYEARLGNGVTFSADWHNKRVKNPTVQWYVAVNDGEKTAIDGANSKTYTHTFTEFNNDIYYFSVVVNEVECTQLVGLRIAFAEVDAPTISAENDTIVDGILQRNVAVDISDIELSASWNEDYLEPDLEVSISWLIGNEVQTQGVSADGRRFVLAASAAGTRLEVSARLSYAGGSKTSKITVVFVNEYVAVDNIDINILSGVNTSDGGALYQIANGINIAPISASVATTPITGVDYSRDCVWSVRNILGVAQLEDKSREVTLDGSILQKGKNVITATIDNLVSGQVIVYVLSETEFQARKGEIEDRFIWLGNVHDHYICDETDLGALVGYLVSLHATAINSSDVNAHSYYLAPTAWTSGASTTDAFGAAINSVLGTSPDEGGEFNISYTKSKIWMKEESEFGNPTGSYLSGYTVTEASVYSALKQNTSPRQTLPIDGATKSLTVRNSNDLYRAVAYGYKPIFENNSDGIALTSLYYKARAVNASYITDSMSEFEKVRAIYEWIILKVKYDYAVTENALSTASAVDYNAYHLEGVFDDGKAVCDGKSKAFSLMCGLEGIRSTRVMGFAGEGHAWNKVFIDVNGDGVREWYIVDTTWGDSGVKNGDTVVEFLSYSYFLVSDEVISETHTQRGQQPAAVTPYNAFEDLLVDINGEQVSLYVTSRSQLKKLVAFALENNVRLNIMVNMTGITRASDLNKLLLALKAELGSPQGACETYPMRNNVYVIKV